MRYISYAEETAILSEKLKSAVSWITIILLIFYSLLIPRVIML